MIDNGLPAARASLTAMELVPMASVAGRPQRLLTSDGIARLVLIGALVILLLPALLLLIVVALLVPCLLRVPVCGTSLHPIRLSSTK